MFISCFQNNSKYGLEIQREKQTDRQIEISWYDPDEATGLLGELMKMYHVKASKEDTSRVNKHWDIHIVSHTGQSGQGKRIVGSVGAN